MGEGRKEGWIGRVIDWSAVLIKFSEADGMSCCQSHRSHSPVSPRNWPDLVSQCLVIGWEQCSLRAKQQILEWIESTAAGAKVNYTLHIGRTKRHIFMTVSIGEDCPLLWVTGSQFKGWILELSEPKLHAYAPTVKGTCFLSRFLYSLPQIKGFKCWTATPSKDKCILYSPRAEIFALLVAIINIYK